MKKRILFLAAFFAPLLFSPWRVVGLPASDGAKFLGPATGLLGLKWVWDCQTTVDSTGDVGRHPSIALGTDDSVHIAYEDTTNNRIRYAVKPGGGASWSALIADGGTFKHVSWPSIAVGPDGAVHLTYYLEAIDTNGDLTIAESETYQALRYRKKPETGLGLFGTEEVIDGAAGGTDPDVGKYNSIAVDGTGGIHISYYDATNTNIRYATRAASGTTWAISTLAGFGSDVGPYNSLAVQTDGTIHLSYYEASTGSTPQQRLRYQKIPTASAAAAGTFPSDEVVDGATGDTDPDVGKNNSIAVDSTGKVHLCYRKEITPTDFDILYASNATGTWATEALDTAGWNGVYCAVTVGGSPERVHVSHAENNGLLQNLIYSWKDVGSTSPLSHQTVVAGSASSTTTPYPTYNDIAVDPSGGVHIALYDGRTAFQDLRYCYKAPPPAQTTTEPTCGDGTCNGTETCSSCVSDCGACLPPTGGGSGESSGGVVESGGSVVEGGGSVTEGGGTGGTGGPDSSGGTTPATGTEIPETSGAPSQETSPQIVPVGPATSAHGGGGCSLVRR